LVEYFQIHPRQLYNTIYFYELIGVEIDGFSPSKYLIRNKRGRRNYLYERISVSIDIPQFRDGIIRFCTNPRTCKILGQVTLKNRTPQEAELFILDDTVICFLSESHSYLGDKTYLAIHKFSKGEELAYENMYLDGELIFTEEL
jgi:hypothetical protein